MGHIFKIVGNTKKGKNENDWGGEGTWQCETIQRASSDFESREAVKFSEVVPSLCWVAWPSSSLILFWYKLHFLPTYRHPGAVVQWFFKHGTLESCRRLITNSPAEKETSWVVTAQPVNCPKKYCTAMCYCLAGMMCFPPTKQRQLTCTLYIVQSSWKMWGQGLQRGRQNKTLTMHYGSMPIEKLHKKNLPLHSHFPRK